jgi:hypothetical protein
MMETFLYCLAVAAERTGVLLHAVTVMSNHYHLVATDPLGRMPEFYAWLHEFVAKALNAHYARWENFWAGEPTSCVRLTTDEDVLAKTVYTLANPVAAGLVSHGDEWPGVRLYGSFTRRLRRPTGFFRTNGPTPEEVTLKLTPPPIGASSPTEVLEIIDNTVKLRERELRETFRQEGRRFLGSRCVLAQRWSDTPASREPRRELSPRIACRNKWRRIEVLQRCKQFLEQYRDAWKKWAVSARDVLFPAGTYQMLRRFGVPVAPS